MKKIYVLTFLIFSSFTLLFSSPYVIKLATFNNKAALEEKISHLHTQIKNNVIISPEHKVYKASTTVFPSRELAQKQLPLYRQVFQDAYISSKVPRGHTSTQVRLDKSLYSQTKAPSKVNAPFIIKMATYSNRNSLLVEVSKLDSSIRTNFEIHTLNKSHVAYSTPFASRVLAQRKLFLYKKVFKDAYITTTIPKIDTHSQSATAQTYTSKPMPSIHTLPQAKDASFVIKLASYTDKKSLYSEIAKLATSIKSDVEVRYVNNLYMAYSRPFTSKHLAQNKLSSYKKVFVDAYIMSNLHLPQKIRTNPVRLHQGTRYNKPSTMDMSKIADVKNPHIWTTDPLEFKQSSKVYHKYGSSQMHGMTIYLSKKRGEVRLRDIKAYLIESSTSLDTWYNNNYLKDKARSSLKPLAVSYVNTTHIDSEKKFIFYGIPAGDYYIIIESDYPRAFKKKKKIYIAKKFKVEKFKKLIVLFSKAI